MSYSREDILEELNYDYNWAAYQAWENVRDWIADMVSIEPKIMRKVSEARFGDLGNWIQRGSGNVSVCGCLVGTCALELVKERNHFKADLDIGAFEQTVPFRGEAQFEECEPHEVVEKLVVNKRFVQDMTVGAEQAGYAASTLGTTLGNDMAVWLIKDEIIRQLALRSQRRRAGLKSARLSKRTKTGQFRKAA